MVKLIKIIPSNVKGKKYSAFFKLDNGKEKKVNFGARGYRDYTLINNPKSKFYIKEREKREKVKQSYLKRHAKEDWNNVLTAGSLSRWVLWELPSLAGSIRKFKNKFNL
jgi:hypothetical protein